MLPVIRKNIDTGRRAETAARGFVAADFTPPSDRCSARGILPHGSCLVSVFAMPIPVRSMFRALAALIVAAALSSPVAADEQVDKQRGMQAIQAGDFKAALAIFVPLANAGDPFSQFVVGQLTEQGSGVPQNYREAVRWYKSAAEAGQPDAMTNLGFLYEQGKGVPQDYKEALRLYTAAAELGNPIAATNLGNTYLDGKLVPQNDKEALKWYTKGAELGDPFAQYNLGKMYERGRGVAADPKKAFAWYREAAEAGVPAAQINLGIYYAEGLGTEKNAVEAHKWFNLAASNADDDNTRQNAAHNRDLVATKLKPDEIERAQALARDWKPKQPAKPDAAGASSAPAPGKAAATPSKDSVGATK